jgi:hypothetical protein
VHFLFGTDELVLSSDYLIKSLYIGSSQHYLRLSDNYFDVVPDKKRQVSLIKPPGSLQSLRESLQFRSYREVFDPAPLRVKF